MSLTAIALMLFSVVPVGAYYQREQILLENDRQAIFLYREALLKHAHLDLKFFSEPTCDLIADYEELSWLEEYSAKRSATLGKLGIKPESVEVLKLKVANELGRDFYLRVEQNRPLEKICVIDICAGNCSAVIVDLRKTYKVGNRLEALLTESPMIDKDISRQKVRELWKKSVIEEADSLREECGREMKLVKPPKYGRCWVLNVALERGIEPEILGLSPGMIRFLKNDEAPEKMIIF